jgi:hypothetical protein
MRNPKYRRKYRPRVTEKQKKEINIFTLAGMSQRNIAKQAGLPAVTVGNIQRALGIAPRSGRMPLPAELEQEIIRMRRKHGAPFIAKKLGLPRWRVENVFRERRFLETPGKVACRYYLNATELRAMRRKRRAFEHDLAKQFGVSQCRARRFNRSQI